MCCHGWDVPAARSDLVSVPCAQRYGSTFGYLVVRMIATTSAFPEPLAERRAQMARRILVMGLAGALVLAPVLQWVHGLQMQCYMGFREIQPPLRAWWGRQARQMGCPPPPPMRQRPCWRGACGSVKAAAAGHPGEHATRWVERAAAGRHRRGDRAGVAHGRGRGQRCRAGRGGALGAALPCERAAHACAPGWFLCRCCVWASSCAAFWLCWRSRPANA